MSITALSSNCGAIITPAFTDFCYEQHEAELKKFCFVCHTTEINVTLGQLPTQFCSQWLEAEKGNVQVKRWMTKKN